MSKETIEKKLYPSQINTKTISARIPVQDYVRFLQESLKNNISLNDWLLLKIYKEDNNKIIGVYREDELELIEPRHLVKQPSIKIYKEELDKSLINFYKNDFQENDYLEVDKEDAKEMLNSIMIYSNMSQMDSKKEPSLMDIKVQLKSLVRSKIHKSDQYEYLKEINELLKELE